MSLITPTGIVLSPSRPGVPALVLSPAPCPARVVMILLFVGLECSWRGSGGSDQGRGTSAVRPLPLSSSSSPQSHGRLEWVPTCDAGHTWLGVVVVARSLSPSRHMCGFQTPDGPHVFVQDDFPEQTLTDSDCQ